MIKRTVISILLILSLKLAGAQASVNFIFRNKETKEPVSGVSIQVKGSKLGAISDTNGHIVMTLPSKKQLISFSSAGFEPLSMEINITGDTTIITTLERSVHELEEVIISSTRTDSRIENTPTRVEVLGSEEVDEEGGVKPSHIASLLGDVAGIQSQQTSPITGNVELRIQGLPGDYTQLLRDGMPLFGGYAGGFNILQIPPLDLKQIEIIKGASSTLYGGGAIAGMINIISKQPRLNEQERFLLLNHSSLKESNVNVYLSDRDKKRGYTFLGGGSYQKAMDVNKDGFSDLPLTETILMHPSFFFYPNDRNKIIVGINSTFEERKGGDMAALRNFRDNNNQFFILNRSYRNNLDATWNHSVNASDKITIKGIASWFYRNITTNAFGFKAKQLSWFTEASYVTKRAKHDIVSGINFTGEHFKKHLPDSSRIADYDYAIFGIFMQDDWRVNGKWTIESGIRADFHNEFGTFLLPRISILYKISPVLNSRLGGGLGYKAPSLFNSEVDERDYKVIHYNTAAAIKAERSSGANWDINFRKKMGAVLLTINQSFYFTHIKNPLMPDTTGGSIAYRTELKPVVTKGFETWLMASYQGLEAYFGYTMVDAKKKYDPLFPHVELSARNKFASVISYEFSDRLRACLEASYTGRQYLEGGRRSPSYPILAAMVRYDIRHFSFVLNCENILDYRQTKKESIIIPPTSNPRFKQIWAPIDGRVVNLSMKVKF